MDGTLVSKLSSFEIYKYDLSIPEERMAYENTNEYALYFLYNLGLFSHPNTSVSSFSKRDIELAKECGYELSDTTERLDVKFSDEQMEMLLREAYSKYGGPNITFETPDSSSDEEQFGC